jgi:hypothetical protein
MDTLLFLQKESEIPDPKPPYSTQFREQMVGLVCAGKKPAKPAYFYLAGGGCCTHNVAMRSFLLYGLWALMVGLGASVAGLAQAQPPARDLSVEIRQLRPNQDEPGTYRLGTRSEEPLLPLQKIVVRNGEKGTMSLTQGIPLQWVQSAQQASAQSGASVQMGLQWLPAGRSMVVQPRWPGGRQPATVVLTLAHASLKTAAQADVPEVQRAEWSSTVTVPLGEWVTFAATGAAPAAAGSYSSEASTQERTVLQIRVLAP